MLTNRQVFDEIAPGWYNYRHWSIFGSELEALAARWWGGSLLNLGCAHGPDFLPFREGFDLYGLDFSPEMLKQARRYAEKFHFSVCLVLGDVGHLPFAESTFDHAIAVATYHHLENPEGRLLALQELRRVLRPGGEAFITVWNRWQRRFWLHPKEVVVPWRKGERNLGRYYYLFSSPEFTRLVKQAGLEILTSAAESGYRGIGFFSRNICLLVRRPGAVSYTHLTLPTNREV